MKARCLSLLNKQSEALDALLVATSIFHKYKEELKDQIDFTNIKELERFKELSKF